MLLTSYVMPYIQIQWISISIYGYIVNYFAPAVMCGLYIHGSHYAADFLCNAIHTDTMDIYIYIWVYPPTTLLLNEWSIDTQATLFC